MALTEIGSKVLQDDSETLSRVKENKEITARIRVIGIGNEFRNDDAVGLIVARKLKRHLDSEVSVKELCGEGGEIMESWIGADGVFLIDAVSSASPKGTIFRIDATQENIPSEFFHYSTHAFSVAESVELSRVFGILPKRCTLFGIVGADFGVGNSISPTVLSAADTVVNAILRETDSMLAVSLAPR